MKRILLLLLIFYLLAPEANPQKFKGSFDLVAEQNYTNGNIRRDTISYYFGDEKTAILIYGKRNDQDMRMVFNPADKTITSLFEMNEKKGGFILPMDEEHWPGISQSHYFQNSGNSKEFNYTGNEKVIENYKCREVIAESDDYNATLWIAEDIPLSMTCVLSYQSVGKGKSKQEIELFNRLGVDRLPLELFLKSKKGKADVIIRLINLKETIDDSVFSTQGHFLSKVE